MSKNGRVTISEIAKQAETSPMAVSVVLNGARSNTRVSDATRRRILSIAADLNYSPNAQAQSLKRKRTNTLGILFTWAGSTIIHNLYSVAVLDGIVAGAAEAGYHILLYTTPWISAAQSSSAFADQRADGVVVVTPRDQSDVVTGLVDLGLKVSVLSALVANPGIPAVTVDNHRGIRLALDHLRELGHTRIAYAGHGLSRHSMRTRYEAYCFWMAEQGLSVREDYVLNNLASVDKDANRAAFERLYRLPDPPTAICASLDDIAVEAMDAARGCGIAMPEQLSVTGFDNLLVASLTVPKLTTVHQPLFEMGKRAAELLVASIEGRPLEGGLTHIFAPELIRRESTAAPSAAT